jgi:hypothetical protein
MIVVKVSVRDIGGSCLRVRVRETLVASLNLKAEVTNLDVTSFLSIDTYIDI